MRTIENPRTTPATPLGRWTPLALAVGGLVIAPLIGGALRLLRATLDPVSANASGPSPGMLGVSASLLLAGAGLVTGIRALRADARTWPVWLGTLVSGAITLLWVVFVLAEILVPH
ncbi:MAG TPA: hypothetical protein VLA55_00330 [Ornithinibacter sp.]|nr:hypothetical protein [Ornithinibacter sp.]